LVKQLNVELSKAKDGRDNIQILSDDFTDVGESRVHSQFGNDGRINLVLTADKIMVTDNRGNR